MSGYVSEHFTGDAVDITAINGTPIAGHQGAGTITDLTIRALLTLQGEFVPHQIISLMQYPGAPNTLAMPEHWNHIHVGFHPTAADLPADPGGGRPGGEGGEGRSDRAGACRRHQRSEQHAVEPAGHAYRRAACAEGRRQAQQRGDQGPQAEQAERLIRQRTHRRCLR